VPARAPNHGLESASHSQADADSGADLVSVAAIDPARYAWFHGAAIVALVTMSLAGQTSRLVFGHDRLLGLVRDFDLNNERNVPTWFQSGSLLLGAVLAELVNRVRRGRAPDEPRRWRLLACGLAAMSIDEGVSIHERMTVPIEALRNVPEFHPFSWVLPGAAIVVLLVAYLRPWVQSLPGRTARLITLAGVLYFGGAVGLEAAGGVQALTTGINDWLYVWTYTAEETFEMAGMLVLNFALLEYLSQHGVTVVASAPE